MECERITFVVVVVVLFENINHCWNRRRHETKMCAMITFVFMRCISFNGLWLVEQMSNRFPSSSSSSSTGEKRPLTYHVINIHGLLFFDFFFLSATGASVICHHRWSCRWFDHRFCLCVCSRRSFSHWLVMFFVVYFKRRRSWWQNCPSVIRMSLNVYLSCSLSLSRLTDHWYRVVRHAHTYTYIHRGQSERGKGSV